MAKKLRKAKAKLAKRIKNYEKIIAMPGIVNRNAYTRPGSLKYRSN